MVVYTAGWRGNKVKRGRMQMVTVILHTDGGNNNEVDVAW